MSSLVEDIKANMEGLEGITVLGGEPLQQPDAVLSLMQQAKELGLTVMLYTGYEPHEYTPVMQACHDASDLLIGGRYVAEQRDPSLRWRGSTNQSFISPTVATTRRPSKTSKKLRSSSTTIRGKLR